MKKYGLIGKICLAIAAVIILADVFLAVTGYPTISSTALYYAMHGGFSVPFALGALMTHLFVPFKNPIRWLSAIFFLILIGVVYLDFSHVVRDTKVVQYLSQYPWSFLLIGTPFGLLFQQKRK